MTISRLVVSALFVCTVFISFGCSEADGPSYIATHGKAPNEKTSDRDLKLENVSWLGKFSGYFCEGSEGPISKRPSDDEALNLIYTSVAHSDGAILIAANFTENKITCSYTAILRDSVPSDPSAPMAFDVSNASPTNSNVDSNCIAGKQNLDQRLTEVSYTQDRTVAKITLPASDESSFCSSGSASIELRFARSGAGGRGGGRQGGHGRKTDIENQGIR